MQEPMKEHHIDAGAVELKFWGPSAKKEEAIQALQSLGFVNLAEALPWRQAFPEYDPKSLPGVVLRAPGERQGLPSGSCPGVPAFPSATSPKWSGVSARLARKWPRNWGRRWLSIIGFSSRRFPGRSQVALFSDSGWKSKNLSQNGKT